MMPRASARPALFALALASAPLLAGQSGEPAVEHAEPAPLAARSLLLDVAAAGGRLVAVGERGHVLLSDDGARSWHQAERVPTRALLTAVCFFDERSGLAVGHDEVILHSTDAGRTWALVHHAPEAHQPLLDVWCGEGGRAIAVGAYGSYYTSADGGASWSARPFEPAPLASRESAAADPYDEYATDVTTGLHLNAIASAGGSRLYIAAEAGRLYRSDDGGAGWIELPSPYEGSLFGVLPLGGDALLAFGLRGHLFRSDDGGTTWRRLDTGTVAMLNGGCRLDEERVVIVGLSGAVLTSADGGRSFALEPRSDRSGLSAVVCAGPVVAVGEGGARRLLGGTAPSPKEAP